MAFGAAVLLGWTLLGGLDPLNQAAAARWLGGGMCQQLALLAAFALIGGLLDLPFTLWQTFRHRGALRLQQDDLAAVARRRWSRALLLGAADRPADRGADPLAHGRGRQPVVAVGLGRLDGASTCC